MLCGLLGESDRYIETQKLSGLSINDEKRLLPTGPTPGEMTKRLDDLRTEMENDKVDW